MRKTIQTKTKRGTFRQSGISISMRSKRKTKKNTMILLITMAARNTSVSSTGSKGRRICSP